MLKLLAAISLAALSCSTLGAMDKESIERGKKIYDTVCFACHGKDLEGATGFNLKDSEWVHGSQPEQILTTIKNGFPDKGMIAFGAVYKEDQLKDIVNFILSKQEGLRDLQYEIYQGLTVKTKMNEIDWDKLKADKSGTIKPSYVDLNIPEVDTFGMKYSGKLIIPEEGQYTLFGNTRQSSHVEVLIDGKPLNIKIQKKRFSNKINLSSGEHTFELRFVKNDKYCTIGLNLKKKGYDIPLSMSSFRKIRDQKVIIGAVKEPIIVRKRIIGVPSKSIAVAFPEKVNFVFNPANGSINAMWLGEFLDIAPNINGRGNNGSKALGDFIFNGETGLDLLINGKEPATDFIKYSTYMGTSFIFTANGKKVMVSASAQGQAVLFSYKTEITEKISFNIPHGVKLTCKQGKIDGKTLTIDPSSNKEFSIMLAK